MPAPPSHARCSAWAPFAIAALVALCTIAGIYEPAIYQRETASWAAQAVGQDWVSLLVAVPWLLVAAALAWRGSRRAQVLVGGGLLYTAYSYAVYAFAVHFNALFLVYCAVLGMSVFALVDLIEVLRADEPTRGLPDRAPVRTAAGMLFAIAGVFGALWLRQDIAAMIDGVPPADLAATGLISNPVHVLDLSLLLPMLIIVGVSLWRRRRLGWVLAPIALAFAVVMTLAIIGMIAVMYARGITTDVTPAVVLGLLSAACVAVLASWLRHTRRPAVRARRLPGPARLRA